MTLHCIYSKAISADVILSTTIISRHCRQRRLVISGTAPETGRQLRLPSRPHYGQCCSNTRLIKATHTRTIDHFVRYLCTLWCTGALWYAWTLWYARTLWYAWTRMAASDTQLIATLSPAAWPNEKQTLPNLWLLFAANAGSCFSWSRSVEAAHGLRALFGDAW